MIPCRYDEMSPLLPVRCRLHPSPDVPHAGAGEVRPQDVLPSFPRAAGRATAVRASQETLLRRRVVVHAGEVSRPAETHGAEDAGDGREVAEAVYLLVVPHPPCLQIRIKHGTKYSSQDAPLEHLQASAEFVSESPCFPSIR